MASVPNIDRDAIVAALRARLLLASVVGRIINPEFGSWNIDVRVGEKLVSISWGPLSGFGGTDHQALREDVNPFGAFDWPLSSEAEAIEFVLARLDPARVP